VDGLGNWLSIGYWSNSLGNNWGSDGLNDSWGLTVDDGVESVDWVGGVGDGTDGTIGLNKGVLSADNISVTSLVGGLGVSGEGIRDGVSVVVLWVWVVWLGGDGDGLGNGLSVGNSNSLGNWLGISDWGGNLGNWLGIGEWLGNLGVLGSIDTWMSSISSNWGSSVGDGTRVGEASEGQDSESLDHFDLF
jgi:hypothetical protein